jgi:hypothetical protein
MDWNLNPVTIHAGGWSGVIGATNSIQAPKATGHGLFRRMLKARMINR